MSYAEKQKKLTVDLEKQKILQEDGNVQKFEIEIFRKKCLLEGLDDIALTLEKSDKITEYEVKAAKITPWIYEEKKS